MNAKTSRLLLGLAFASAYAIPTPAHAAPTSTPLDMTRWRVIERESGPVNYYTLVKDPEMPFIRARYRPPYETTVLGYDLGEQLAKAARRVTWKWRAITLPKDADECANGKGDSAAVVYFTWKRGLRYYTLKYVWTTKSKRGAVCQRKRNPFVAQDTVILRSGGAGNGWQSEAVDLHAAFRRHFADGDPNAEIPRFLGVAIMTDGDQTQSKSEADYADFRVFTAR